MGVPYGAGQQPSQPWGQQGWSGAPAPAPQGPPPPVEPVGYTYAPPPPVDVQQASQLTGSPYAVGGTQPYGSIVDPPAAKPSRLGEIGLILSTAALLVSLALSALAGGAMRRLNVVLGSDWTQETIPPEMEGTLNTFAWGIFGQIAPTIVGLAGLVLGFMALGRAASRGYGIAAIAVALIAPVVSFVLLLLLVLPSSG